jgi:hypothetical protein
MNPVPERFSRLTRADAGGLDHLGQDHTHGEEIRAGTELAASKLFGRHVGAGTGDLSGVSLL